MLPDDDGLGQDLYARVEQLYPLRRCLTGDGLRQTLAVLGERLPMEVTEVPSGTPVLDWTVPQEWRVRDAYVALPDGTHVVDWADHPLHLVQYSQPVRERMSLASLRPHLHTLPDQPDLIPYRTSYYASSWGFCLSHRALDRLAEAWGENVELEVLIDADLFDGSLSYGEVVVPGRTEDEVVLSAHACHPALANDNASSLAVAGRLAERLLTGPPPRHTVRFLFAPGTLGAIAWLDRNRDRLDRIRHGLVLANLGDPGRMTYKRSRRGTLGNPLPIDLAVEVSLRDRVGPGGFERRPFTPMGYDERQFGSPGFDLPVGRLTRTPHGEYPEYHTSGDDLTLVRPEALAESYVVLRDVLTLLDGDAHYRNTAPFGEPHLGRRGLYAPTGGDPVTPVDTQAVLWTLNLSDGEHGLLDVAEASGLPFPVIRRAADRLAAAGLLAPLSPTRPRGHAAPNAQIEEEGPPRPGETSSSDEDALRPRGVPPAPPEPRGATDGRDFAGGATVPANHTP